MGGGGDDVLVGGAGDDTIVGDSGRTFVDRSWSLTREVQELPDNFTVYRTTYQNAAIEKYTDGGADLIYGGAGKDWVLAGVGDDVVDGGADDDVVFGEEGNDQLLGGIGDDVLNGDALDDPDGPGDNIPGSIHGNDYSMEVRARTSCTAMAATTVCMAAMMTTFS